MGELKKQISQMDEKAERGELDVSGWEERYKLEDDLAQLYKQEELYWQRRGGVKWILEGDANTGFFHSVANGRRRKCMIEFLDTERDFYKTLFGREERGSVRLGSSTWRDKGRLNSEQKENLIRTFSMEEAKRALKEMRTEIAPGWVSCGFL
jgi:hypothetical protein